MGLAAVAMGLASVGIEAQRSQRAAATRDIFMDAILAG
jgi:hypothetical protein